jgi:hypothetical protein
VFETHRRFVENSGINLVMVGMLSAIPKTPLYKRLAQEGRLDPSDVPSQGTNVLPLQMSRDVLSRGYVDLMAALYEPKSFFDRFDALWLKGPLTTEPGWRRFAAARPWARWRKQARSWVELGALATSMLLRLRDSTLRRIYLQRCLGALRQRPDGVLLRLYLLRCAVHFHLYHLARLLQARDRPLINTY